MIQQLFVHCPRWFVSGPLFSGTPQLLWQAWRRVRTFANRSDVLRVSPLIYEVPDSHVWLGSLIPVTSQTNYTELHRADYQIKFTAQVVNVRLDVKAYLIIFCQMLSTILANQTNMLDAGTESAFIFYSFVDYLEINYLQMRMFISTGGADFSQVLH